MKMYYQFYICAVMLTSYQRQIFNYLLMHAYQTKQY